MGNSPSILRGTLSILWGGINEIYESFIYWLPLLNCLNEQLIPMPPRPSPLLAIPAIQYSDSWLDILTLNRDTSFLCAWFRGSSLGEGSQVRLILLAEEQNHLPELPGEVKLLFSWTSLDIPCQYLIDLSCDKKSPNAFFFLTMPRIISTEIARPVYIRCCDIIIVSRIWNSCRVIEQRPRCRT